MISLSNEVNEEYETNKKTDKQVDNWIQSDKIKEIYQDYYNKALKILKQRIINKYDTEIVIKYLLLGFYQVYLPLQGDRLTMLFLA